MDLGQIIKSKRLELGFKSRASLVKSSQLRDLITQEGLRKIEEGERVPRVDNLRAICQALGLSEGTTKELESMALDQNVQRVVRNAKIEGEVPTAPAQHQDVEKVALAVADELVELVDKLGVLRDDLEYVHQFTRKLVLKKLGEAWT